MFLNLSSDVWESSTSFDHQPGACEAKVAPGRFMVKSMDNLYNAGGSVCINRYSIQKNWTLFWTVSCWHYIIDTHTYIYIYLYEYIYIWIYIYIHIYIWIYIYILYQYVNIYICIHNWVNILKNQGLLGFKFMVFMTPLISRRGLPNFFYWATAGKLVHLEIETCYLHVTQYSNNPVIFSE